MYLYRPCFQNIDEAVDSLLEFRTMKQMYAYIIQYYPGTLKLHYTEYSDIRGYSSDDRIGWKRTFLIIDENGNAGYGYFTRDLKKKDCIKAFERWDKYWIRKEKDIDVYDMCLKIIKSKAKLKNVKEIKDTESTFRADIICFNTKKFKYSIMSPCPYTEYKWTFKRGDVKNLYWQYDIRNEEERLEFDLENIDKLYERLRSI